MREYKPKKDVQQKAYYNDRFWVAPQLPKEDVSGDEIFSEDLKALQEVVEIKEAYIQKEHLVCIIDCKDNLKTLACLKENCHYNFLMEMGAVDFLAKNGEFEIFYELLSTIKRKRVRIKCSLKEEEAIESVTSLFKSADWSEREMFDLSGVKVNNHPNLKRLIMPDDWSGHPLRKDYPLIGDEAAQWYEIDKIFGKEYREVVGPENRDQARVDKKDTENYAKIKHEVPKGAKFSDKPTDFVSYQEKEGVLLISEFDKDKSETLKARK